MSSQLDNPYYVKGSWVGVLGTPLPGRSENDSRLQAEFNASKSPDTMVFSSPNGLEKYCGVKMSDFGPRTENDKRMLREFDPYLEAFKGRAKAKENYSYGGGCTYASTSDQPSNPYQANFVSLNTMN